MNNSAARAILTLAAALFVGPEVFGTELHAQIVRGTVRSKSTQASLDRAQVYAQNEVGQDIGFSMTDERGRFFLKLTTLGRPFTVTVRRLGIAPTKSDPIKIASSDTADIDFLVEESSTAPVDTFKVQSQLSINDKALAEAERRGWKMFTPKEVEQHRQSARTVQDLLRSWGNAGLIFNPRIGDCVRSTRNNLCLDWVLDGHPVGTNFAMDPRDIYFLAVVGRTEAMSQWGNKTPNGAIVIYTRMYGDKIK